MKLKPGYRTSEFWFTVVSFIFSGLYLTGLISDNEHKEELITTVSHAVESCILISGQLVILYKYINGRSKIKQTFKQRELEDGQNISSDEPTTTNKTRSRKTNTKRKKQPSRSQKNSN